MYPQNKNVGIEGIRTEYRVGKDLIHAGYRIYKIKGLKKIRDKYKEASNQKLKTTYPKNWPNLIKETVKGSQ